MKMNKLTRLITLMLTLCFSAPSFASAVTHAMDEVEIEINQENSSDKNIEYHSYHFGNVPVGSRYSTTYTLTNRMNIPLVLANGFLNGPGFEAFHNCYGELRPGYRCSFTLTFNPYRMGFHNGVFVMNFYQNYSIQVNLSGNAFFY